jgi:PhnB protein
MIRVILPAHLRTLARLAGEVELDVEGPVTPRAILEALEARYPMLRGTIRDQVTGQRRPYVRFFACEQDLSHESTDAPVPAAVVAGAEPFLIVGAIAGGSGLSVARQLKEGTMQLSTHLLFNGQCEAAFQFYEQCLGAKITFTTTYAGTPAEEQAPAEWRSKILHATLQVGDQVLMGADSPPGRYQPPQGFSVSLAVKDPAEAERIFHALAEYGKVIMPIQPTFWSPRFGMFVDRFGIPWMINCEQAA